MKSVLISIQPKWVNKIASGEKTIEVRKTRPKIEMPFKCYIYETKGKQVERCDGCDVTYYGRGKVIGEFICDKIDEYLCEKYEWDDGDVSLEYRIRTVEGQKTCLEYDEVREYGNEKPLYFWHITDLKIYDKPKELSEFKVECPTKNQINGDCNFCKYMKFSYYGKHPKCNAYLTRPPQSWCYVESLGE